MTTVQASAHFFGKGGAAGPFVIVNKREGHFKSKYDTNFLHLFSLNFSPAAGEFFLKIAF